MLSDADVERWSRQILLPEVGGRGQERLLAARAAVTGRGASAELAATLIARAGVGLVTAGGDVSVDLDGGTIHPDSRLAVLGRRRGARAVVATLIGRPCAACLSPGSLGTETPEDLGPLGAAAELALGALAAAEALRVLLTVPAAGRLQTFDLERGVFGGTSLAPSAGCVRCGPPA
jgi:hypothetical protein